MFMHEHVLVLSRRRDRGGFSPPSLLSRLRDLGRGNLGLKGEGEYMEICEARIRVDDSCYIRGAFVTRRGRCRCMRESCTNQSRIMHVGVASARCCAASRAFAWHAKANEFRSEQHAFTACVHRSIASAARVEIFRASMSLAWLTSHRRFRYIPRFAASSIGLAETALPAPCEEGRTPLEISSMSSIASIVQRAHLPLSAMLLATALLAHAPTVLAQDDSAAASAVEAKDLSALKKSMEDFTHYVLIGKSDLAIAAAEGVLGASASDADLATAVDEGGLSDRLAKAVSRSRAMVGVAELGSKIEYRVEAGRLALARDPARIAEAIAMLSKTQRQRMIGEERISAAGEYAVAQLLKAFVETKDPAVELAVARNIVALKRQAVLPLSMALVSLDSASQRKVAGMLAEVNWPTAIPFLVEVAADPAASTDVKAACDSAFTQLGGSTNDVSAQFTALASKFFRRDDSLVPHPADATNNLWSYDSFAGLQSAPVATNIFCDMMAMAMARRALAADATNSTALAIYVAADLRRENTLGSDAQAQQYSPQFFATTAGPSVCAEVLAMGLDSKDTALVRDAIAVLAQTAGQNALASATAAGSVGAIGRAPMLEAMRYADRRVRLDAALALANSQQTQSFPGDFSVVPTLASAISDNGSTRAGIIGGSLEDRQAIGQQLQGAGLISVANAADFDGIEVDVVRADGVDIIVLRGTLDEMKSAHARVRASGLTGASPVLVIANAMEDAAVRSAFTSDTSVLVWTEGSPAETFRNAASAILAQASGSVMDEAESTEYAARCAEALRGIAFSNSKIFAIQDAEAALLGAFATKQGGLRMMIAEVLALHASPASQSALIDAALAATGDEQIALCDLAGLSARTSGTSGARADDRQLSALRDLIAASTGAAADAAGRLYGSLDAGSAEAVKLITK